MRIKKYQTPFSPIWKMELDNSNARIPSLSQIKILAEQQRKAKVVEAASKGDRLAQEELKKDRKKQYRKVVSHTRRQNNIQESNLTRTIDAFAEALIDREVDQLNMPKLVDQGVIEDADKIERAKTLNAINNGGYFWTTGNGFNYTPNYWTPEGLQAIELQFTTNAVNTAAGLSSGFMGPALQTHGFVPLLLSVGGGYAGSEAGNWLTSLFTDNPYWQGAGGFAGMLLGGGLGFKAGQPFLTPEQQLALLFQKATGVNYWNPTSSLVGRYINGLIQPISNEILQQLVLGSMHNPITKTVDANGKIRFRLPSHTQEQPKEVVLVPHGNNKYEVHIRTWDGDHIPANITPQEKMALLTSAFSFLPEGAELMFPESSIEYPATRGTVAALQHASRDPRFLKGTPGTLTYTDKNGSLQIYTGTSLIKRLTKPAQVLELQYPGQRIYFGYFGPKHSINEVVNPDGTVNIQKAMQIANRAAYEHGGIRMLDRLENPEWHKTDPNTFLHTKEVAQRAWQMPTPAGYTKQDQMFAALGHDFGKMFAGDNHAQYGADYLRQVFPDMTDAQYRAIAHHMMSEDIARTSFANESLTLATMDADRTDPVFRYLWDLNLIDAPIPGYLIKELMSGSPLSKLLSKTGEISVENILRTILDPLSKQIVQRVLDSRFAGKTKVSYNALKLEVNKYLNSNITRSTTDKLSSYGVFDLGYYGDFYEEYNTPKNYFKALIRQHPELKDRFIDGDDVVQDRQTRELMTYEGVISLLQKEGIVPLESEGEATTNLFMSPIFEGRSDHFKENPYMHIRTFTANEHPDVLFVLEGLSDAAQHLLSGMDALMNSRHKKRINTAKDILLKIQNGEIEANEFINEQAISKFILDETNLMKSSPPRTLENKYLSNNYIRYIILESLRDAANKGKKKIAIPIDETAAIIQKYNKSKKVTDETLPYLLEFHELSLIGDIVPDIEYPNIREFGFIDENGMSSGLINEKGLTDIGIDDFGHLYRTEPGKGVDYHILVNVPEYADLINNLPKIKVPEELIEFNNKLQERQNVLETAERNARNSLLKLKYYKERYYDPKQETILKKYRNVPNVIKKYFPNLKLDYMLDSKGNTWYVIDVPEDFLLQEWKFKLGGNLIPRKNYKNKLIRINK